MDLSRTIGQLTGNRFQSLVSRLLSAHIPDFQAVNGAGGDSGNDGYSPGLAALFQAYGPDKLDAVRIRQKIADSVEKAAALRETSLPGLRKFVFVTPFDLTHEHHLYLQKLATEAGLIAESWGNSKLTILVPLHREAASTLPEIQVLNIVQTIHPDPAYIKEHFKALVGNLADSLIIRTVLRYTESLEKAVRTWLDPTEEKRARLNFPALVWTERRELIGNLSRLREMGLASARDALKSVLAQLDEMLALHEKHEREPPLAEQQALTGQFFEYTAQVKQRLEEALQARN